MAAGIESPSSSDTGLTQRKGDIMAAIELYPPGGGAPVTPHPSKIELMKSYGWREKPAKKPKQQKEES